MISVFLIVPTNENGEELCILVFLFFVFHAKLSDMVE